MLLRFRSVPRLVANTKSVGLSKSLFARCSFRSSRSIGKTSTTRWPASVFESAIWSFPALLVQVGEDLGDKPRPAELESGEAEAAG
jgi:hypothetical protein